MALADSSPRVPSNRTISRRTLLQAAAATTLTIVPRHVLGGPGQVPPSAKTTIAGIGLGGQGIQNMVTFQQMPEVQIVAVCDVQREATGYVSYNWRQGNEQRLGGREPARRTIDELYAAQKNVPAYRGCKAYSDFRELLEREDVDAVMIATPDHNHAVISMAAIKRKKHVYCEKPLTWSVHEARTVTEAARAAGVATQLGNHGQATEEARVTIETIQDGAIGNVREVQVWCPARFWAHYPGETRPTETPPIPEGLDWDLWLGPAPYRPYHPAYHPWTWRNWWDFGTGLLGDLGCHKMSTVFKALKLGHPTSVEACCTKLSPETYPLGVIARFEFPAREGLPPVTISWSDGGLKPPRPNDLEPNRRMSTVIYLGDKGTMMEHRIIPESRQQAYGRAPKKLPRSPGHHQEFINACRGGERAGSDFVNHSGLLSEACLLANVAVRCDKKLLWDGPNCRFTNDESANRLLHREYRAGWSL